MNKVYIRFPGFKLKAVTLSYDDGVRQDKRLISIMQKYGLKGKTALRGTRFPIRFSSVRAQQEVTASYS